MTKTINFKIKFLDFKTPTEPIQISNLTDQDRLADLKTFLINLTGSTHIKILHGYPPKELDLSKEETQLGTLFKSFRESLIVKENVSTNTKETNSRLNNTRFDANAHSTIDLSKGFLTKNTGQFLRKIVPANNSCLFTAVYFCISNGVFKPNIGNELRKLIVKKVRDDPIQFNDAILGCPSEEYQTKIMRDDVWGGGIELRILSDYYFVEIVAVDTINVRLNRFGEDKNYNSMIFLIYDGIHYDSLYFEKFGELDKPITIFSTRSEDSSDLLVMALDIAREAKKLRQFTDIKNFKLRCLVCNDCFTGTEQANSHAKQTSHTNFGEF